MADTQAGQFQQPYLYGEAKNALETPMQAEMYTSGPEMESQWKQPWKHESYPKMEAELAFPGAPGYQLPSGQYGPGDCEPQGDAIGGSSSICEPGVSCAKWSWSCAHKITKFSVVQDFGFIQSIQYGPNDTVTVTVCWNEADRTAGRQIGVKGFNPTAGKSYVSKLIDFGACCPMNASCLKTCTKCPALSIGHTTHQMSAGGTQALTASGGGGKYTWTLNGGGSLNKTTGSSVIYTAASGTNANCANNALAITLKDCCGSSTSIAIAVNTFTTPSCGQGKCPGQTTQYAVQKATGSATCVNFCPNTCFCICASTIYGCDGSFLCGGGSVSDGGSCGPCVPNPPIYTCGGTCGGCSLVVDVRNACQKAAGCCPEQLL